MKTIFYAVIWVTLIILTSCSGTEKKNFTLKKTELYQLDSLQSEIRWERSAEYKILNKKVKLFGSYVTVNLENMNYTTSGSTPLLNGELVFTDSVFARGGFSMDFSICRFYNEEEEAFLTTEHFPPAVLTINTISPDSSTRMKVNATLNLLDSTKNISFPAFLEKDSLNNMVFKGTYLMQTLDWPIRQNPDRNNIKKDEITFTFHLLFKLNESKTDSIF